MTTLFIEADEPLLVFSSVEVAEQHLEPIDVRSGVYKRAFGPAGEPFSITTEDENVVIRAIDQPTDPAGLWELLRRSLQSVGEEVPPDADLPTLVAATEAFWTRRQRAVSTVSRWGRAATAVFLAGLAAYIWW